MDFLSQKKKADEEDGIIEDEECLDDDEINEFFNRYNLTSEKELPEFEKRILYYLSGHTIFSIIKKKLKTCSECLPLSMTKGYDIDIAIYQKLKDYTGEALIECDSKLFDCFFLPAEKLFREFVTDDLIKK